MARILDRSSQNPRMQCACCGKWMRLHSKDGKVQRFYGSCHFTGGDHAAATKDNSDVCDACCREKCRAIAAPQSFGVAEFES